MSIRVRIVLAALLLTVGLPGYVQSAAAGCAAPTLEVVRPSTAPTGSPSPPVIGAGEDFVVSGEGYTANCPDSIGRGPGCSSPPPVEIVPLRDVELVLSQGARRWSLGRTDAGSETTRHSVSWTGAFPRAIRPGPAELRAVYTYGSQPVETLIRVTVAPS